MARKLDDTSVYAGIVKFDEQEDGTVLAYGKATDDTIDSDAQICDPNWLAKAMPEWFKYGNIREQHSNIAAGVATEYEAKGTEHFITAHIVDPTSAKKVKTGVLKGFSIGIRGARVIKDNKAAGGRIIDGQIVEVSIVDRPANPSCSLTVAKTIGAELVQVEEYTEKEFDPDQARDENGRWSAEGSAATDVSASDNPADGGRDTSASFRSDNRALRESQRYAASEYSGQARVLDDTLQGLRNYTPEEEHTVIIASNAIAAAGNSLDSATYAGTRGEWYGHMEDAVEHLDTAQTNLDLHGETHADLNVIANEIGALQTSILNTTIEESMNAKAEQIIELSKGFAADTVKFDKAAFDDARRALATLIQVEAAEMAQGEDESYSLACLLTAVHALMEWHEGEARNGEVEPIAETEEEIEMSTEPEEVKEAKMCDKCNKAADECECGQEADKSVEAEEVVEEVAEEVVVEEVVEETPELTDEEKAAKKAAKKEQKISELRELIVEVVKSLNTTPTGDEEVVTKAAAAERIEALEAELQQVKALAAPSGPKRFAQVISKTASVNGEQAALYRAKAAATLDKSLAQGYIALAADLEKSESN